MITRHQHCVISQYLKADWRVPEVVPDSRYRARLAAIISNNPVHERDRFVAMAIRLSHPGMARGRSGNRTAFSFAVVAKLYDPSQILARQPKPSQRPLRSSPWRRNPPEGRNTMRLCSASLAVAAITVALAAVSSVDSASAATAIEYGLIFGWP